MGQAGGRPPGPAGGPGAGDGGAPTPPRSLGQRLRAAAAARLDLPEELLLDLPRITLLGTWQCMVENHHGLIAFTADRVTVATSCGPLVVCGRDLRVGAVRDGEIVVTGELTAVRLEGAGA